ncbi:hypothetical protein L1049_014482 [Liquidambar formosana]|uniref:Uncharacterized protein n=1 Tax=Liquidambar formosana TaxID=63359 RepID=A0AAP0X0F4_LIQFO
MVSFGFSSCVSHLLIMCAVEVHHQVGWVLLFSLSPLYRHQRVTRCSLSDHKITTSTYKVNIEEEVSNRLLLDHIQKLGDFNQLILSHIQRLTTISERKKTWRHHSTID